MSAAATGTSRGTRAGADAVIGYADAAGRWCHAPLKVAWGARFEDLPPIRSGPSRHGRGFEGSWWFATTGRHVDFASWAARDRVMLADFDPNVTGLSSRPFELTWTGPGETTARHVPDYFARLADGSAVVIDVHPGDRVPLAGRDIEAACATVGWGHRWVGPLDAVLAANLRWLAGYRHPRCRDAAAANRLLAAARAPVSLADAAASAGEPLVALPTLFHLIWVGALVVDVASAPLTPATTVTRPGGPA